MKSGDVVQLKSGGPLMTVAEVRERECHTHFWHDGQGHECRFYVEQLVIIDEDVAKAARTNFVVAKNLEWLPMTYHPVATTFSPS